MLQMDGERPSKAAADESPTFTSDLELYRGRDGNDVEVLSFHRGASDRQNLEIVRVRDN